MHFAQKFSRGPNCYPTQLQGSAHPCKLQTTRTGENFHNPGTKKTLLSDELSLTAIINCQQFRFV